MQNAAEVVRMSHIVGVSVMTNNTIICRILPCIALLLTTCTTPPKTTTEDPPSNPFRVLIIGDSISKAYTRPVGKKLKDSAVVVRPKRSDGKGSENCKGTTKGVKEIDRWLTTDGGDFDIIHFNFGLHDIKRMNPNSGTASTNPRHPQQATLEVYTAQLEKITERMQESGAILVFATTTPVPEGGVRPHRDPKDVVTYNAAAVDLMEKRGIAVNDLYTFALPRLEELQRPVNVHFTRIGSDALAEKVAEAIILNAPSRPK